MNKILTLVLPVLLLVICQSSRKKETLKDKFYDKFLIGVAVNRSQIDQKNKKENALIASEFNSLTAENDMKWMHIHPEKNKYNFEYADKLV
ncbi:MAG TPA: endo-1,4-beta-xylanase, partial [Ohtaekwangia sp.]|nr:endo-1,4-beta-xylanase [Ohtaekwangia sp.]